MSDLQLKRNLLFTPLEKKEDLHAWIRLFLGLDIPDSIVDPSSTISPMGSIWKVYDRCRRNEEDDFNTMLSFASRMSFKTLGAAVLEVLMVCHLERSVAHMAAIKPQSQKSQEYVKKFFRRPILKDFLVGNNATKVEVVRYRNRRTGDFIPPDEWTKITPDLQDGYEALSNYITIVVCTMQGANSEHVPFMVVDEVDVVSNPAAYEEAKAIPDTMGGKLPVTLLTSTRKFSYGLVQKEIDRSHQTGLLVEHWNILDVTEKCPPKRHLPDEPKIPIWVSDDLLRAVSQEEYEDLSETQREKYVVHEGFQGCLSKCKIFSICKGRLATSQISESNLLKKIQQVQNQMKFMTPEMVKAQLLCSKPSTEGLIYPRLDRSVHILTAQQIAKEITGRSDFPKNFTKGQLIELAKSMDVKWRAGMDFGYTHNFVVVTGFRYGYRFFVIDVVSQAELDPGQMISVCDDRIKPYFDPVIWADSEDPGRIKMLRSAGYRMREAPKPKGSVIGGIEMVRLKLWPATGKPELYFLAEDEGVDLLFTNLQGYHWETDAAGRVTNVPDEEGDDECDALRYLIMNTFQPKAMSSKTTTELDRPKTQEEIKQQEHDQWQKDGWKSIMSGLAPEGSTKTIQAPNGKKRKGRIIYDF